MMLREFQRTNHLWLLRAIACALALLTASIAGGVMLGACAPPTRNAPIDNGGHGDGLLIVDDGAGGG
jgi:hypothetical protein